MAYDMPRMMSAPSKLHSHHPAALCPCLHMQQQTPAKLHEWQLQLAYPCTCSSLYTSLRHHDQERAVDRARTLPMRGPQRYISGATIIIATGCSQAAAWTSLSCAWMSPGNRNNALLVSDHEAACKTCAILRPRPCLTACMAYMKVAILGCTPAWLKPSFQDIVHPHVHSAS